MKAILIVLGILLVLILISIPIMELIHRDACYHIPFDEIKNTDCASYLGWQK